MFFDDLPKQRLENLWQRVKEFNLQDELGLWYLVLIAAYGSALNFEEATHTMAVMLLKVKSSREAWELGFWNFLAGRFYVGETVEVTRSYLLDALEIFQQLGVIEEQGSVLLGLSEQAVRVLDYELAIEYSLKAKHFLELVGDEWGVNGVWNNLGEYNIYLGRIEQAFQAYRELRNYSEKRGNRRMLGTNYSSGE